MKRFIRGRKELVKKLAVLVPPPGCTSCAVDSVRRRKAVDFLVVVKA